MDEWTDTSFYSIMIHDVNKVITALEFSILINEKVLIFPFFFFTAALTVVSASRQITAGINET